MPPNRIFQHSSTAILVVGGLGVNGTALNSVEILELSDQDYQPLFQGSGSWEVMRHHLNEPRAYYPSLSVLNGRLIVAGGKVSIPKRSKHKASKSWQWNHYLSYRWAGWKLTANWLQTTSCFWFGGQFGDWKKLSLNFPLTSLTGNLNKWRKVTGQQSQ